MISGTLTKDNPETPVFNVLGEAFICLKGTGAATIYRKIGANFEVMTSTDGVPMVFVNYPGSDLIFNNSIFSNKRFPYKIVAEGTVTYEIAVEDR